MFWRLAMKRDCFRKVRNVFFSTIMRSFWVFPIQKKVVFSSFWGRSYNDNPKFIFEAMKKLHPDYKYIWLMHDKKYKISDAKVVKFRSISALYHLATARIWVDNGRKQVWMVKRKKQYYVQTWHGDVCVKKIEKDAEEKLPVSYIENAKHDSKLADLFLSGAKWRTENYRSAFWYDGEILEMGCPKSDIFYSNVEKTKKKIYSYFGLNGQQKILLYAPTFRDDKDLTCYDLDYEKILKCLQDKWDGEWKILVRLHPNIQKLQDKIKYSENILNASRYPDVNELIVATEVLVTDYSGCMFDGLEANKKVFLYASDISKYAQDRGFYFNIQKLPFPLATTTEELEKIIEKFDVSGYYKQVNIFRDELGFMNGKNHSLKIAEYIFDKISCL